MAADRKRLSGANGRDGICLLLRVAPTEQAQSTSVSHIEGISPSRPKRCHIAIPIWRDGFHAVRVPEEGQRNRPEPGTVLMLCTLDLVTGYLVRFGYSTAVWVDASRYSALEVGQHEDVTYRFNVL